MKRNILLSVSVAFALALGVQTAFAQTSTTGAVRGIVKDAATGEPVVGATVVATSPALQGQQAEITDGSGSYNLSNLPPGTYEVTVYFSEARFSRSNVLIRLGKTVQVNIAIDSKATGGEIIKIEGTAPIIDQGSTKTGITINQDYTDNVPTGRTFGAVLGAAAGSQGDLYGVSFGGSTSVENVYIIEGINTTDPAYGLLSSNLPNEFVRETEVITGGYSAEYGRSTGGVVNVLTKTGSNEFRGSVFTYFTPGQLVAGQKASPRAGSSIDRSDELAYAFDVGAEVGGPIVKDKLWFHAGINPSFRSIDVHRIIKTQVDRDSDGVPDADDNGFTQLEELERTTLSRGGTTTYFTGKLTGAVDPNNQGSLSFFGNPEKRTQYGRGGTSSVTGVEKAGKLDLDEGALDVSAKWTSKFNNNKTQVDAVLGWHRNVFKENAALDGGNDPQIRFDRTEQLSSFGMYENVPAACDDMAANDPYPMIDNCPVTFYNIGGVGFRETQETTRISAALSATQRVKLAGHHTFKVGADVEQQAYDHLSDFTGGARFLLRSNDSWRVDRFFTVGTGGVEAPCGSDLNNDGMEDATCTFQPDGLLANTSTQNIGAYAQDSWSILPNLTFNAGLRWEQQTLYVADGVRGKTSPTTGLPIPDVAFKINDMFAPRLGLVYDPTKEGKAKVFGHWGRFYESIPMDINARAYGGEVFNVNILTADQCDAADPVNTCDLDNPAVALYFGGGEELVTPGLGGQFLDEVVIGGEYEVLADLKVGANLVRRGLGRVIEDVSTDGANTYIIANPGEIDMGKVQDLRDEADAIRGTDPDRADFLDFQADNYEGVASFDKPNREYNALQLTAERRFTKDVMVKASYTFSQNKGNFPGLFSPETGQLDPNLTSMYDLPELMANRYGELAADRPHLLKIDGYWQKVMKDIGRFTVGTSFRAGSGSPYNTLGSHPLYGTGESYLLPRGTGGRSPFTTRIDTHLGYGRVLAGGRIVEAFVDVFNMFNQQPEVQVDENYTFDDVNPIVGGDESDLAHLKGIDPSTGYPTAGVAEQNPNYGNTLSRQAPLSFRFGLRFTF
jgi:outer membrane receptor protein involved in Fe transport